MTTKRDLFAAALVVVIVGFLGIALSMSQFQSLALSATTCTSYPQSASCSMIFINETLTEFWLLISVLVLAIGLSGLLRSFAIGEERLFTPAAPAAQARFCPACRTWQHGAFCANDGTKLS